MSQPVDVTGAWVMHHDQKLSAVRSSGFESITTAGRAARLLSCISKEDQWDVSTERVQALASANSIRKHEIAGLLHELRQIGVIDYSQAGVSVLGVNQANLFKHAATVFDEQKPTGLERAALDISERASQLPVDEKQVTEELADVHKLSRLEIAELAGMSKQIGFVDHELVTDKTLLFNGSLFRRDDAKKSQIILSGLNDVDRRNLIEADEKLSIAGCLPQELIVHILDDILWSKLHQIGYYQVSQVTNENGSTRFVTRPAALVKYSPGGLPDMHDDAKALASSLTYGILKSTKQRGRIVDPAALMDALIGRGYVEGWAKAIKEDYQTLERRGVVAVTTSTEGFRLTLRKHEIGLMARDLILQGDASEAAAHATIGSQAGHFEGPEGARVAERLKDIPESKRAASLALDSLRKTR